MKNIVKKRFDRSGQTEVRTFSGATITSLSALLHSASAPIPRVEKVVLCVGTNDANSRHCDHNNIVSQYQTLIHSTLTQFPNAHIYCTVIPPQKHHRKNLVIWDINTELLGLKSDHVSILPLNQLWDLVTEQGRVTESILTDTVHLSPKGLGLFLRAIKQALSHSAHRSALPKGPSYADAVAGRTSQKQARPQNSVDTTTPPVAKQSAEACPLIRDHSGEQPGEQHQTLPHRNSNTHGQQQLPPGGTNPSAGQLYHQDSVVSQLAGSHYQPQQHLSFNPWHQFVPPGIPVVGYEGYGYYRPNQHVSVHSPFMPPMLPFIQHNLQSV
jgi:lysophospholipase L1-like esterase